MLFSKLCVVMNLMIAWTGKCRVDLTLLSKMSTKEFFSQCLSTDITFCDILAYSQNSLS